MTSKVLNCYMFLCVKPVFSTGTGGSTERIESALRRNAVVLAFHWHFVFRPGASWRLPSEGISHPSLIKTLHPFGAHWLGLINPCPEIEVIYGWGKNKTKQPLMNFRTLTLRVYRLYQHWVKALRDGDLINLTCPLVSAHGFLPVEQSKKKLR